MVKVMIYLYAIPTALEQYRNLKLRRQVTYQDHTVRIPAQAADDQFIQNLGALIPRLPVERPTTVVPSRQECRLCDITASDCPDRVHNESHPEYGISEDLARRTALSRAAV